MLCGEIGSLDLLQVERCCLTMGSWPSAEDSRPCQVLTFWRFGPCVKVCMGHSCKIGNAPNLVGERAKSVLEVCSTHVC